MFKKITLVAAMCFAFVLCFALAGCGGSNREAFVGTWELESGTNENLDSESIALMKSLGLEVDLVLAEDGTGALEMFGSSSAITWDAKSATEATVMIDGAEAGLTLEEDKLTLVDSAGASMTFTKKSDDASIASSSGEAASAASSEASQSAAAESAAAESAAAESAAEGTATEGAATEGAADQDQSESETNADAPADSASEGESSQAADSAQAA